MDEFLDRVTVVHDNEQDRRDARPDHCADLLNSQLQASLACEEDGASIGAILKIPGTKGSSKSSASCITDTSPENLADTDYVLGKCGLEDAKTRGS